MENINIQELNERIQKESAFVDLLTMQMGKVIVGQKHLKSCVPSNIFAAWSIACVSSRYRHWKE